MDDGIESWPVDRLISLATGYWQSAVLSAAVQLDVFESLESAGRAGASAEQVAHEGQLCPTHTRALLDALTGMGLLGKCDEHYHIAPEVSAHLCRSSPQCLLDALRFNSDLYALWGHLADCVRGGKPITSPTAHLGDDATRTRRFVLGMHSRATALAPAVLAAIDLRHRASLLDVASGPGTISRMLAEFNPNLRVAQFDLPAVLDVARELAVGRPEADRIAYHGGDYHNDALPSGFDAALLCGALHQESPQSAAAIIGNIFDSLEAGGDIFVVDMMLRSDRTQPVFSTLFSINMMLISPAGRVFTWDQVRDLLGRAGFVKRTCLQLDSSPYWVARAQKPEKRAGSSHGA